MANNWWDTNMQERGNAFGLQPGSGVNISALNKVQAPTMDTKFSTALGDTGLGAFGAGGPGGPTAPAGPTSWDKLWGTKETGPGYLATGFNVAEGLGNLYLGNEQLGLAKDQLATNKQQFSDQFNIQKQSMNRDIYDQGKRRYEMNKETNLDPDAYYEKNKITAGR